MRPETKSIFSYSTLAFIVLILLRTPMIFDVPSSDQLEQMPVLLRSIDADFLKNDWFTNKASENTIRLGYLLLAYPFLKIMHYKAVLILFNFLTDFLTILFSVIIFRKLTKEKLPLLIFLAFLVLGVSFLSFTSTLTLFFVPRKLAFLLVLIGMTLKLHEKRGEFFCFMLAAFIHPHVSAILIGSIYLTQIILKPNARTIGMTIAKSAVLATVVFAVYSQYFISQLKYSHLAEAAYIIAAQVRAPALFHFPEAGLMMQTRFLGLLLTAIVLFFSRTYREKNWHFLASMNLILIGFTIIHYLFTDVITIPSLSMQLLNRATDISFYITSFFAADLLARFLSKNQYFAPLLIAIAGFTPFFIIGISFIVPVIFLIQSRKINFPRTRTVAIIGLTAIAILEILYATIFHSSLSYLLLSTAMFALAVVCAFARDANKLLTKKNIAGIIAVAVVLIAIPVTIDRLDGIRKEADVAQKIRTLTDRDSILLVNPNSYFGTRARMITERAIVVDMKAIPTNYEGIIEWGKRMEDVEKVYPEPESPEELRKVLAKYNVNYLLHEKELHFPFLEEIERFDGLQIYKVELQ